MAGVYPFRAVHYNDLEHLGRLIAPPYDVISPSQQQALYDASPHNIIRLELNKRDEGGVDPYQVAASTLRSWLDSGVLVRSDRPAFYVYRQEYATPDGGLHTRTALFGEVRLEEFETGVIRPHEETFPGPKKDRLQLIRACRANLSPIFGLYRDAPAATRVLTETAAGPPLADVVDSVAVRHQLWAQDNPDECQVVTHELADRNILIADGHHRYETALGYRRERRDAGGDRPGWYDRVLFALVSMSDPGLVVLPTHRILRSVPDGALANWRSRLPGADVSEIGWDEDAVRAALDGEDACCFVLATADGAYRLALPRAEGGPLESLDVTRLHREVLPAVALESDPHRLEIEYTQDARIALDAVRSGRAPAALLVNPTPVERVDEVSGIGGRMPEKSTYFYPKLSTGIVLRVE